MLLAVILLASVPFGACKRGEHRIPVAVWLVPVTQQERQLQEVISDLGGKYSTPTFPPHVTLCTGELDGANMSQELRDLLGQVDTFASSHKEIVLARDRDRPVGQSGNHLWSQFLFLPLAPETARAEMPEALEESKARSAFPAIMNLKLSRQDGDPRKQVMLHLSLMYSKEQAINGVLKDVAQFRFPETLVLGAIEVVTPRTGNFEDIVNGTIAENQRGWDIIYKKGFQPGPRPLRKVVAGGQTGVDQAAWRAARAAGLEIGGWCAPNRDNGEDSKTHHARPPVPIEFPCRQTLENTNSIARDVARGERTRWNVRDADEILVLLYQQTEPSPDDHGTWLTIETARSLGQNPMICDMTDRRQVDRVIAWIRDRHVRTLNVAGPAEKDATDHVRTIGTAAEHFLSKVFAQVRSETF
jgi:hypothetical protein